MGIQRSKTVAQIDGCTAAVGHTTGLAPAPAEERS